MASHVSVPPALRSAKVDVRAAELAVHSDDVITFPSGLPGFEQCRTFVLRSCEETEPFSWLQAGESPDVAFMVIDPHRVLAGYQGRLGQADLVRLRAADASAILWLSIVSWSDDQVWVNLRAPIVINLEAMVGCQTLPHSSLYPLRYVLVAA